MNEGLNEYHTAQAEVHYKVPRDLELLKRQVNAGFRRVAKKYGWADVTIDDVVNLEVVKAQSARRNKAKKITL